MAQDRAQALALFQKACEGGDSGGCFNLGVIYDYGVAVKPSETKALALYRKACEGGYQKACGNYAKLLSASKSKG